MPVAAWPKRTLIHFFLGQAQDLERRRLNRQPLPWLPRLLAPLGRLLVSGPLRDGFHDFDLSGEKATVHLEIPIIMPGLTVDGFAITRDVTLPS